MEAALMVFIPVWSVIGLFFYVGSVDNIAQRKKLLEGILLVLLAGPCVWFLFVMMWCGLFMKAIKERGS